VDAEPRVRCQQHARQVWAAAGGMSARHLRCSRGLPRGTPGRRRSVLEVAGGWARPPARHWHGRLAAAGQHSWPGHGRGRGEALHFRRPRDSSCSSRRPCGPCGTHRRLSAAGAKHRQQQQRGPRGVAHTGVWQRHASACSPVFTSRDASGLLRAAQPHEGARSDCGRRTCQQLRGASQRRRLLLLGGHGEEGLSGAPRCSARRCSGEDGHDV